MSNPTRYLFSSAALGALVLTPVLALAQAAAPAAPAASAPAAAATTATPAPAHATPAPAHATPAPAHATPARAARVAHHAIRRQHSEAQVRSASAELGFATNDLKDDRTYSARVALERAETAVLNERSDAEGVANEDARATALSGVLDDIMAARTALNQSDRATAARLITRASEALKAAPPVSAS